MDLFIIRRCLVLILGGSSGSDQYWSWLESLVPLFELTSLCFGFSHSVICNCYAWC